MTFFRMLGLLTVIFAATALGAVGQEGESKTIQDGVYTEAQAGQGGKLWQNICGECHQADEFVGDSYMASWTNVPVAELFDLISVTMPEDNPGSLRDGEYAAVIAYVLSLNGLPAGEEALPEGYEALQSILIQGPYGEQ